MAPRHHRRFSRLTPAESKAVELHAVDRVRQYFEELGYDTKDVGATESYDVHAAKDGRHIKIEVKGTTSDGSDIVLTAKVALHETAYPDNALALVRHIRLQRQAGVAPATSGVNSFSKCLGKSTRTDCNP